MNSVVFSFESLQNQLNLPISQIKNQNKNYQLSRFILSGRIVINALFKIPDRFNYYSAKS